MRTFIAIGFFVAIFSNAAAYDPLDPTGNITIKWDVVCLGHQMAMLRHRDVVWHEVLQLEAGATGNVQSEVLLQKDTESFSFKQGWAFPRKVYFNGDSCMLPLPDSYPYLPNSAHQDLVVF